MGDAVTMYVHRLFGGPHDGDEFPADHQYEKYTVGGPWPENMREAYQSRGWPLPPEQRKAVYLPDPDTDPGEMQRNIERIDVATGNSFCPPIVCVAMRFAGYAD